MNADKHKLRNLGKPALDLLEEAVSLLRQCPSALVPFFVGAVPFWLGLLYFVSDMTRSADAAKYMTEAALGVAVLFIWAKCWETVFCAQLRANLLTEEDEPWNGRRIARLIMTQTAFQPLGLIVRPVGVALTLPYVWVSSFFQNVTVLGDGGQRAGRSVLMRSLDQAKLWPGQAHSIVAVLWAFSLFVWGNVVAVLILLPIAMKMFFGVETAFSRSLDAYINSTFLTATLALTALCVQPLWRAAYVLRCFYGVSLRSGDDLKLQLRQVRRGLAPFAAALLVIAASGSLPAPAQDLEMPDAARQLSVPTGEAAKLDEQIREVLERREFAWRAPRERIKIEDVDKSWLERWMEGVTTSIERVFKKASQTMDNFFRKLFNRMNVGNVPSGGGDWSSAMKGLAWLTLILASVGLCWVLWRVATNKGARVVTAEAVASVPDLRSEDVAADQLPEEGWMELAREHAGRGDLVLALRAAWLACLAHLGRRELLTIARHKSNREYQRELRRRAISQQDLLSAFGDNLSTFERAWYGRHQVTPQAYERFTGNYERMRGC